MAWARLHDGMHQSRKVRRLDSIAFRLYVSAILDCCREQSDGVIEGEALRELLPRREFDEDHIRTLLSSGLIHDEHSPFCGSELCLKSQGIPAAGTDSFVVHDFGEWQMTTDEWSVRKASSQKANHTKWHVNKGVRKQGCRLCFPVGSSESESDPESDSDSYKESNAESPVESRPDLT